MLLTGSNGFLGHYIYKYIKNYFVVSTLTRSKGDYKINLEQEIPNFSEQYEIVIHAAGKAHTNPKSNQEIASFYNINVIGTKNLLEGLSKSLPKQFVFISSVSVYGLIEGLNINETAPLLAEDPYGKSKIDAENLIKNWCEENNVICTILRLPLIVGVNPPGNLGSLIRGIKKRYYFNIGGGKAKKSMVLATDIAKFILNAAQVGGTYNLTDGIHPTFKELSNYIVSQLGKSYIPNLPLSIAKQLAFAGDIIGDRFPINSNKLSKITSTLTFDDSKARAAFGWDPTPVLEGFKLKDNDQ